MMWGFFLFLWHQYQTTMLKYKFPVIAVRDLEESIRFYEEVVGDRVAMSFDDYVHFEGGYALEEMDDTDAESLSDITLRFEEDDLDGFAKFLDDCEDIRYVNKIKEADNGQRIIRILDPNDHIIEVVENMDLAIKRMLANGMTVEQVSEKSQYPIEYVQRFA